MGIPAPDFGLLSGITPEYGINSGVPLSYAYVVAPLTAWTSANIDALWISAISSSNGAPGGYEYFTSFNIPTIVKSANLALKYRADDLALPQLNGVSLPNLNLTSHSYDEIGFSIGGFGNITPASYAYDITNLVHPGNNTLSFIISNLDTGGLNPTGLQFSANITYDTTPTPIPPTFLLMGSGLVGLIGMRKRIQPLVG
jgi:hypothetical protein